MLKHAKYYIINYYDELHIYKFSLNQITFLNKKLNIFIFEITSFNKPLQQTLKN